MVDKLNDAEWLKRKYDEGYSLQDIANELGKHRNTVRNRFIKFGIKRHRKGIHFKGVPKPTEQRTKMSAARKAYWDCHPDRTDFKLKVSRTKTKHGICPKGRRIYIPGRGRVLEHRLVMEKILGRQLKPNEQVHHRDGDRLNNDPTNLILLTNDLHQKLHNKSRPRDAS